MKLIVLLFLIKASADSNIDSHIRQGQDAAEGTFPYQIGLTSTIPEGIVMCGGSLISPTFILTVAHCIDKSPVENITAFLGSRYIMQGTNRSARVKFIHSDWDRSTAARNDIGLVQIDYISYSDRIQKIDLPALSDEYLDYEAHIAITSGWGIVNATSGTSPILQYSNLLVISNAACGEVHGRRIPGTIICAADPNGATTCPGDSGGPLVDMDSRTLIGITSFGPIPKCDIHFACGFTRVTFYRQWIYNISGV